jgi:hypothetical protein
MRESLIFDIGGKKIDTRTRHITKSKATFNERFAMKTSVDYDPENDEYHAKVVSLRR